MDETVRNLLAHFSANFGVVLRYGVPLIAGLSVVILYVRERGKAIE